MHPSHLAVTSWGACHGACCGAAADSHCVGCGGGLAIACTRQALHRGVLTSRNCPAFLGLQEPRAAKLTGAHSSPGAQRRGEAGSPHSDTVPRWDMGMCPRPLVAILHSVCQRGLRGGRFSSLRDPDTSRPLISERFNCDTHTLVPSAPLPSAPLCAGPDLISNGGMAPMRAAVAEMQEALEWRHAQSAAGEVGPAHACVRVMCLHRNHRVSKRVGVIAS